MTQWLIKCVDKVLLKNNGKYICKVINNNYNLLPTYITSVMTWVHISYNAFIAFSALNLICALCMLWT